MRNSRVFVGMGSNLGDREQNLYGALRLMHYYSDINVVGTSGIYETEPVGVEGHPDYLNMTAEILTTRSPVELLETLQSIEDQLGHERGALEPRVIDLDILLFGDQVVDTDTLVIPHPRMTDRKFVLQTLLDIDRNLRDPRTGVTIQRHFDMCRNHSRYRLVRE